jgi:3-oxoacyl-[acyl-carrier protein] reductase
MTRVALVTGGSRGIGAAICHGLGQAGFAVGVNFVASAERAAEVVAGIEATGGAAAALCADVSAADQVGRLVTACEHSLGPVDVLINNAGASELLPAVRQSPAQWDRTIAVNLSGAYYATHAVLPGMVERRWGRVVCIGSPAGGRTVLAGQSAYAAAKAGLVAMARSIAQETSRSGVTVNVVTPGFVETDLTQSVGASGVEFMKRNWPTIVATSIADCIAFLVSEEAKDVSGEDIGVWRGGPNFRP